MCWNDQFGNTLLCTCLNLYLMFVLDIYKFGKRALYTDKIPMVFCCHNIIWHILLSGSLVRKEKSVVVDKQ